MKRWKLFYKADRGKHSAGLWYDGVSEAEAMAAIAAGAAVEIRVNHECGCTVADDGTLFSSHGACEAHASAPRWKERG